MTLGCLLLWLIGSVFIGNYAIKLNRNYWTWVAWAIITSPLIAWILLEIVGNRLRSWTKDDINTAKALIRNKEYSGAIALLKNVIITDPTDSASCYNIACLYSILKDQDNAFLYLKMATERGYTNKRKILTDKDLEWLRMHVNVESIFNPRSRTIPNIEVNRYRDADREFNEKGIIKIFSHKNQIRLMNPLLSLKRLPEGYYRLLIVGWIVVPVILSIYYYHRKNIFGYYYQHRDSDTFIFYLVAIVSYYFLGRLAVWVYLGFKSPKTSSE